VSLFSISDLRLSAITAAVPKLEVRNEDLELEGRQELIRAVGINSRRVAPADICGSDLCVAAARALMERCAVGPEQIGVLVFVTQTPDYPLPGNSALVQHRLNLSTSTYLLDVNQGCAGYVYGLASMASLMSAARISKGLLLVGDTITRLLSPGDRSTIPLFSDAGSATLLESAPGAGEMYFNLGNEGAGADVIRVKAGGSRQPFAGDSLVITEEEQNLARAPVHLAMRGIDVLHYTLKYVVPSIKELLAFAKTEIDTPDYYVFHQANRIVNECLVRRLGIPADKAPETLLDYGNTSCATIPVTLCRRLASALESSRKKLLLSGFGAGFSWGNALLDADSVLCPDVFEIDHAHGT
jgi:3-oxoacyl-[acyl-carrier-protein] synthase III